jgi:hypothetical protein
VAETPRKSDRAIAKEIGVSAPTVGKARRRATVNQFTVDGRVGLDGKVRRLPARIEKKTSDKPKPRSKKSGHAGALTSLAWSDAMPAARAKFIDDIGVKSLWYAMTEGQRFAISTFVRQWEAAARGRQRLISMDAKTVDVAPVAATASDEMPDFLQRKRAETAS